LEATFAIWLQLPVGDLDRSTLYAVSLVEVSVQTNLIWLDETAEALRLIGAVGALMRSAQTLVVESKLNRANAMIILLAKRADPRLRAAVCPVVAGTTWNFIQELS
jgi:hypothetical protein